MPGPVTQPCWPGLDGPRSDPAQFAWAGMNYELTLARFPGLKKPGFVGLNPDLHLPLEDFSRKMYWIFVDAST